MKIAIHGPMCSGKTTISNIIKEYDDEYNIYSFGGKIKEIAQDLFKMNGKDRTLLITIAKKMKEIDSNIWINYIIDKINHDNSDKCIIDDLRFQNEIDNLNGWKIISLTTPKEVRIKRIMATYKDNYKDHLKNIDDISETSDIKFPKGTIYIDTSIEYDELKEKIYEIIQNNCV